MKAHLYFFILIILFCLNQCHSKSDTIQNSRKDVLKVDNFKLRKGSKLPLKDWSCHKIGENCIYIPATWKTLEQNNAYYFCYLDNNNDNTYFTIMRYNVNDINIDTKTYLRETYIQLVNDTVERGIGYTVKKLIFRNKDSYYCEYYTKIKDTSYLTYSMIFNQGEFLYDISLKTEKDVNLNHFDIFQDILYNFRIKGKHFFVEKDKLKEIQIIDLSTL